MNDTDNLLQTVEHETGPTPEWTVLWLHGLGADGHDFAPIVPELVRSDWPALRFVFPHAPVRPVTINNGMSMRAWYDIVSLEPGRIAYRADEAGVRETIAQVQALAALEQSEPAPARSQPLFMSHGLSDPVVPYAGGEMRAARMRGLGFEMEWHAYPMAHQVCAEEIRDLGDWLGARFGAG